MKMGTGLPAYRTFPLDQLKEATNNFDASSLISEGPLGQVCIRSYKGLYRIIFLYQIFCTITYKNIIMLTTHLNLETAY